MDSFQQSLYLTLKMKRVFLSLNCKLKCTNANLSYIPNLTLYLQSILIQNKQIYTNIPKRGFAPNFLRFFGCSINLVSESI